MYTSLPKNMPRMFELRESRPVDDINDIDVNGLLDDIFSVHVIKTTKKNADNSTVMYNIMPKAKVSLKVNIVIYFLAISQTDWTVLLHLKWLKRSPDIFSHSIASPRNSRLRCPLVSTFQAPHSR